MRRGPGGRAAAGLVILTTNLKVNIDPAFLRRLRFVIDFPMPDAADRARASGTRVFPADAPCGEDVDIAFLAQAVAAVWRQSIQTIASTPPSRRRGGGRRDPHAAPRCAATRAELSKNGMDSAERRWSSGRRCCPQEAAGLEPWTR